MKSVNLYKDTLSKPNFSFFIFSRSLFSASLIFDFFGLGEELGESSISYLIVCSGD